MQGDPRYFTGGGSSGYDYEQQGYYHNADVGGYYSNEVPAPGCHDTNIAGTNHGCPGMFNGIELQASENCPKNFVIFDQTNNTSRMMFNPSYAQKLSYQGFNVPTSQAQGSKKIHEKDDRYISSSSFKEESEDINALLSLDDDDEEEEEDDVVSTGRTPGNYDCNSPDSTCSTAVSKHGKQRCTYAQNAAAAGPSSERKRARVKKMVKVLRGIVPGGQQMDTPAFLDEAVKYLKSLKMEVKKLEIQNTKN